jgi:hypothetical protein
VKLQGVGGSGTGTAFVALDSLSQIKNVLTYQKGPVPEILNTSAFGIFSFASPIHIPANGRIAAVLLR